MKLVTNSFLLILVDHSKFILIVVLQWIFALISISQWVHVVIEKLTYFHIAFALIINYVRMDYKFLDFSFNRISKIHNKGKK